MISKKPHLLKISQPIGASFIIKGDAIAWDNPWHYHPELELIYCIKGKGTNFVGNAIVGIEEGEILLFGSNLPHTRQRDKQYYLEYPSETPESIVIQFKSDFLGSTFLALQEFSLIADLFKRSIRGIKFYGRTRKLISNHLATMSALDKTQRILTLLSILDILSRTREIEYLNPFDYSSHAHEKNAQKINRVFEYTITHFRNEVKLEEIARLTNLSTSAFCRYFKSRTRRSYFQYLSEVRIGFASKLLGEADKNIKQIAYESGFNNLSHFNKQFKKIMKLTPKEYIHNTSFTSEIK